MEKPSMKKQLNQKQSQIQKELIRDRTDDPSPNVGKTISLQENTQEAVQDTNDKDALEAVQKILQDATQEDIQNIFREAIMETTRKVILESKNPPRRSLLRQFGEWWETTPVERFLEDIEDILQKSALLSILSLVANITIVVSLFGWWVGRSERRENEIFQTWEMTENLSGDRSEAAKLIVQRLHRNGASLTGLDLRDSNLYEVNLQNAHMLEVDLTGAMLIKANLRSANLTNSALDYARLSEADLRHAYLQSTSLLGATLEKANLSVSDLFRANLADADMTEANLQEANLVGANLQGAILENANLQGAFYSVEVAEFCSPDPCPTLFPEGFNPDDYGMQVVQTNEDRQKFSEALNREENR